MVPLTFHLNLTDIYNVVADKGQSALHSAVNTGAMVKEEVISAVHEIKVPEIKVPDTEGTLSSVKEWVVSGPPAKVALQSSTPFKTQLLNALPDVKMPNISSLLSGANDWFVSGPPSKLVHLMLEAARHSVEYIKGHKEIFITATAAAVVIPVLCYALPKLLVGVIQVLGFGSTGVVAGSLASLYQSVVLGGYTTAGSVFASLQSIGALGVFPPAIPVLVVLVLAGCVVAWLWPR